MRGAFASEIKSDADSISNLREVMNIREASQYLGVSPDTLYKYLSRGRVPAFKLGNRWKFKKSTLDRWMERQSQFRDLGSNKRGSSA